MPKTKDLSATLRRALVVKRNLIAKSRSRSHGVAAQRVAGGVLRNEHKELVIRHRQTELLGYIVVVRRCLIAGTAGTVEGCSSIDTRGADIASVLARYWIASAAWWLRFGIGSHQSGGGDDQGENGESHIERLGLSIDLDLEIEACFCGLVCDGVISWGSCHLIYSSSRQGVDLVSAFWLRDLGSIYYVPCSLLTPSPSHHAVIFSLGSPVYSTLWAVDLELGNYSNDTCSIGLGLHRSVRRGKQIHRV